VPVTPVQAVACPPWCVECWRDLDPGVRFHQGQQSMLAQFSVRVERYDEPARSGETRVGVAAPLDASLRPAEARLLAASLLAAADEAEQR